MMVINDNETCPQPDSLDPNQTCHGYRSSKWFLFDGTNVARCTGGHVVEYSKWIPNTDAPSADELAAVEKYPRQKPVGYSRHANPIARDLS